MNKYRIVLLIEGSLYNETVAADFFIVNDNKELELYLLENEEYNERIIHIFRNWIYITYEGKNENAS